MAIKIHLLVVNHPIGLIGLIKPNPHFINHSSRKIVINLTRFCDAKPPTRWQASQNLQHLIMWATSILHVNSSWQ
jgi:hypothetical protein